MSHVGAELKKEREAKSLPRSTVARDTGIFIHHLAALEHGNFDDLPDDETVAGFVRVYAEYLGFLPDEPVAEFWAERGKEPPAAKSTPAAVEGAVPVERAAPPEGAAPAGRSEAPRRPPWPWLVACGLVILVLVWLWTRDESETEHPGAKPEMPSTVETVAETPAPEPRPARPRAVEPPAVDPAPIPDTPARTRTLAVTEHGAGTGVVNRDLVGESDRFAIGTKVWFWTRVTGGAAGDEIRHVWIHEGRGSSAVTLPIGSANWRTRSAKTMIAGFEGRWAVEARDVDGNVLARTEFTCER